MCKRPSMRCVRIYSRTECPRQRSSRAFAPLWASACSKRQQWRSCRAQLQGCARGPARPPTRPWFGRWTGRAAQRRELRACGPLTWHPVPMPKPDPRRPPPQQGLRPSVRASPRPSNSLDRRWAALAPGGRPPPQLAPTARRSRRPTARAMRTGRPRCARQSPPRLTGLPRRWRTRLRPRRVRARLLRCRPRSRPEALPSVRCVPPPHRHHPGCARARVCRCAGSGALAAPCRCVGPSCTWT
mmetsp:Transcript_1810/g.5188  ORF Transcript_1810/g.5188 Transcript_1810/m.5188 type:complete len:242 (-) Transcript_1810:830-1555(-)